MFARRQRCAHRRVAGPNHHHIVFAHHTLSDGWRADTARMADQQAALARTSRLFYLTEQHSIFMIH
jgi:hypothetical protein